MGLKAFIDYLEIEKKYSNNTIVSYNNDLTSFKNFISKEFDLKLLEDSNYTNVRSWIIYLVDSGNSNKSINRKISSLNSFFTLNLIIPERLIIKRLSTVSLKLIIFPKQPIS